MAEWRPTLDPNLVDHSYFDFAGGTGYRTAGYNAANPQSIVYPTYGGNGQINGWQDSAGTSAAPPSPLSPGQGGAGGSQQMSTGNNSYGGGNGAASGAQYGGGMSTAGATSAGQNPYLDQMAGALVNQNTQNLQRNVLPALSSSAMASGGYGGSRHGVLESNALSDLNTANATGLASLYGNGFNTALQYDLGLRGNDLGFAGLDAQIAQNNFNNQLTGANFGLGMYDRLQAGNQAGITAGTNIQNTPMNYWSQFANQANSIGQGYGTTTGTTQQQGNPMASMLGGAQLGSQIGGMFGGGGSSGSGLTGQNNSNYNIGSYDYSLGNGNTGLGLSGSW